MNFSISTTGVCTPDQAGTGTDVIQLSKLTGPLLIDPSLNISGGRIYFSTNSIAITSATEPTLTTSTHYVDWVEFALTGSSNQLVVNTTQVDQFGFPITLTVNPPDANFGATAGIVPGLSRSQLIDQYKASLPAGSPYLDTLLPAGTGQPDYRILSPNQAIVKNPSSLLNSAFDATVDAFFKYYSTHSLYLDSVGAYPYVGKVTTVQTQDINGTTQTYTVLAFNFATNGPINAGLGPPPANQQGPFYIYYPFFTDPSGNPFNYSPSDTLSFAAKPPPSWWNLALPNNVGTLNPQESPSQMVFAGNGIFADGLWQYNQPIPGARANILGNLENQVDVALNRGFATSWFTLTGNIGASGTPTNGLYTSTITLSGTYTDQNTPNTTANLHVGMNVLSFAAGIPLTISSITNSTTFQVTSPLAILAENPLYLTFANLYPPGGTWNAYGHFFHEPTISIGGRAYALSFDDQGGFSTTLTSNWTSTPTQATITLGPWSNGSTSTPTNLQIVSPPQSGVAGAQTIVIAVLGAGNAPVKAPNLNILVKFKGPGSPPSITVPVSPTTGLATFALPTFTTPGTYQIFVSLNGSSIPSQISDPFTIYPSTSLKLSPPSSWRYR
ncbi:hypothetical protein AYO44_01565 [Planctomycetaceae bacterium SCGC AG-212-F19]|nr:hypothetical protein AYO44_01565 [Planctomycetaceae bacterium SCGC AG-212-F19]